MQKYNPQKIERKWQNLWEKKEPAFAGTWPMDDRSSRFRQGLALELLPSRRRWHATPAQEWLPQPVSQPENAQAEQFSQAARRLCHPRVVKDGTLP